LTKKITSICEQDTVVIEDVNVSEDSNDSRNTSEGLAVTLRCPVPAEQHLTDIMGTGRLTVRKINKHTVLPLKETKKRVINMPPSEMEC
jgi:hypothetical protein